MPIRSIETEIDSDANMLESTNVSATQRVFNELRQQIIKGRIAPGEKLKIESLKVKLNTGTSPIRLEVLALKNSLLNGGTVWEESLILHHHRLNQESRANAEAFEKRHKAFHRALLAACDSPILLKFCDQLYDLNIRYRFLAGKSTEYDQRDVAREHKDIVDAVLARDVEAAASALVQHYGNTGDFLTDQLTASLASRSC